jgi:hypothetical protein
VDCDTARSKMFIPAIKIQDNTLFVYVVIVVVVVVVVVFCCVLLLLLLLLLRRRCRRFISSSEDPALQVHRTVLAMQRATGGRLHFQQHTAHTLDTSVDGGSFGVANEEASGESRSAVHHCSLVGGAEHLQLGHGRGE